MGSAFGIGLAAWLCARVAGAQADVNGLVRRELLDEAQQASVAGDHAHALELAQRAAAIAMTPSVRMFLAQELGALGRVVEGYASATECVREAEADPALRNRDALLARCRELSSTLRARVGRVTLLVPDPPPPGLQITVAGQAVNPALYGVPYVVAPGPVVIEARDADGAEFHQEISTSEGEVAEVRVVLAGAAAPPPITPQGNAPARTPAPVVALPPPPPAPPSPSLAGPAAVAGVGLLSLGAAAALAVMRSGAVGQLDAICGAPDAQGVRHCPESQSARDAHGQDVGYSIGADVALGVGIAGLAIGAAWFWLGRGASRSSEGVRSVSLVPTPGGGAMLSVGGTL